MHPSVLCIYYAIFEPGLHKCRSKFPKLWPAVVRVRAVAYATTYNLHSLPHNLNNLCHSQITTAHRNLSMYLHIVFMKFLCGLQRFVSLFICTPSTWPLDSRRPGVSSTCHSHWWTLITTLAKYAHKTPFPVAHREHSSTEQHSTLALRYSRYRLTLFFIKTFS